MAFFIRTFFLFLLLSCAGERPKKLGLSPDGKLQPCPDGSNCASSQASDESQLVDTIQYKEPLEEAKKKIKKILTSMSGSQIITENGTYIYAEFSSSVLGFVDDVEIYFDEANQKIHMRSASRSGYPDFGANKKRLHHIIFEYVQM